jgi:drug/metabolite transporter (DMT)-like permease
MGLDGLILMALCCWGMCGIFEKKALGFGTNLEAILTLLLLNVIQTPILCLILSGSRPHWHLSCEGLLWSLALSITGTVANLAYLRAMSKSDASFVLGSTACYPVISLVMATLFLGEKFPILRLVGAAVVAAGVFAISLPVKDLAEKDRQTVSHLPVDVKVSVMIAALAWGLCGIIGKKAVSVADPLEITLGRYLFDAIMFIALWHVFQRQNCRINLLKLNVWRFCGLSSICLALGGWASLSAMSRLPASYVISITACYPVIMYALAVILLKERFSVTRFAGILLIVLGGMFVQLTRVTGAV